MPDLKEEILVPNPTVLYGNATKKPYGSIFVPLLLVGVLLMQFGGRMASLFTGDVKYRFPSALRSQSVTNSPFHWRYCDYERDHRFLCGHLDVPLDYTNVSDARKVRLATTLLMAGENKSNRTLIINPGTRFGMLYRSVIHNVQSCTGGPGGSGTSFVWKKGEFFSRDYTDGQFDVLGWDPRGKIRTLKFCPTLKPLTFWSGVNLSDPSISCFPHDAYRDRWHLLSHQWPETGGYQKLVQADA